MNRLSQRSNRKWCFGGINRIRRFKGNFLLDKRFGVWYKFGVRRKNTMIIINKEMIK